MKKIFVITLVVLCANSLLLSQSIPVTFHYRPDNTTFTALRMVGSFNKWNNADDALKLTDPDADGEYTVTTSLATGTDHNYKFVMDANWGLAYGDPDNPRINLADNNNSQIFVKDPMITYLLPRNKDSNNKEYVDVSLSGNPIRIIFAYSDASPIDLGTLKVTIDGVPLVNPSQYYHAAKKEFIYQPNPALGIGEHTVSAKISSAAGTDSAASTFQRNPNLVIHKVPVDFYYDHNNKTVGFAQTLTEVSLVGSFNNWNDSFNPMKDMNGNGVWETTMMLAPDSLEYKFKLNKIAWINDPDQPLIKLLSGNNLIVVAADSTSSLKLITPLENTVFSHDTTVAIKVLLRPGTLSKGVDTASITVLYDGSPIPKNYSAADSILSANVPFVGEGRHTVGISFANIEKDTVRETFSYGVYSAAKGKYVVDGIGDDHYTYPAGVTAGSADILSVSIQETAQHDSLKFIVQMKNIDERTRLGLLINNPTSGFVNDPRQLEIKLPDWNGQGVFASIGVPGNSFENTTVENKFMVSNNPVTYDTIPIKVNADAVAKKSFEFTVSLAFLNRYMGGWTLEREFSIFSYLAAADKSGDGYEVGVAEGGLSALEDPDIYDAAFIRSNFWQNRILNNYLPSSSHLAILDGAGRGLLPLTAAEISDSLASKESYVKFLTPAVQYWYSNVTVYGQLSDTSIKSISFVFNGVAANHNVDSAKFAIPVVLKEGVNSIFVKITDTNNVVTTSRELVLTYTPDKKPVVQLTGTLNIRDITLTASATSPIGEALNYAWESDPHNPAPITISSIASSITFTLPTVDGEYIFKVNVTDGKSNFAYAKIVAKAKGDSILIAAADDNYHADWVDSAIVYEIYPRSFSAQGGFQGITANIDRIKSLGANTVWFMPVFEGPTTHGYEITDYYGLESDYGTNADFVAMITALKKNGLRVILDLVVNHTGVSHPMMQNVFKYRSYSPWANFYLWAGETGNSNFQYYFDWSSLPNLNHNNPDVRKYFIDVSKYWIENYGIDGYRCDVAWGVEERNHLFWNEWRAALRKLNPDIYLLAEASTSDATFYQKRFESAYDWDLRSLMLSVLNGSNTIGEMHKQIVRAYSPYARPFRFMENHDETRATAMFDAKRSLLTHTVIFTLNGIPLIYSGGEVGEKTGRGLINWNDPDTMHPYFKRLVEIRKNYVHNPIVSRIMNSDTASIYSYASISGAQTVLTAANFKNTSATVNFDFSSLPFNGVSNYYLTDLFSGKVYTIKPADRNSYSLALSNYQARVFYYGLDSISVTSITDGKIGNGTPTEFKLSQNYPNPFNPVTTIEYSVPKNNVVRLRIFNILGQEVATLVNHEQRAGNYRVSFDGNKLSSGVYFYRIEAGSFTAVKKMMLMK